MCIFKWELKRNALSTDQELGCLGNSFLSECNGMRAVKRQLRPTHTAKLSEREACPGHMICSVDLN